MSTWEIIGPWQHDSGDNYLDMYRLSAVAVDPLVSRLRLLPGEIDGPSHVDMLREREEAANEIERQAEAIRELQAALMDAIDWNWLDDDRPDDLYIKYYVLAGG